MFSVWSCVERGEKERNNGDWSKPSKDPNEV